MEPQDGRTLRIAAASKVRDTLCCAGAAAFSVPWVLLMPGLRDRPDVEGIMLALGGAFLAALVAGVSRWRWRAWVRFDDLGISLGHGDGLAEQQLGWAELREVGLLRDGGLILRGEDAILVLRPAFERFDELRLRVMRKWAPGVYRRMRAALDRGEAVEFHGPESAAWAAAKGFLWITLVGLPVAAGTARLSPTAGLLFAGLYVGLAVWRRASRCERIRLDADGVEIRRIGTLRMRWVDLKDVRLLDDCRLLLNAGSVFRYVSPELSNFAILQEIVLERAAKASTSVPSS